MKKFVTKLLSLLVTVAVILSVVSTVSFAEEAKLDVSFEGKNVSISTESIGEDKYDINEDFYFSLAVDEDCEISYCYATVIGSAFTYYLNVMYLEDSFVIYPQLNPEDIYGATAIKIIAAAQPETISESNMDEYASFTGDSFIPREDGYAFDILNGEDSFTRYGVISKYTLETNDSLNLSVKNDEYVLDTVIAMYVYNSEGERTDFFYVDEKAGESLSFFAEEECTAYIFTGVYRFYDSDVPVNVDISVVSLEEVNKLPVNFEGSHVSISAESVGEEKYNPYSSFGFTLTPEEDYTVSYVYAVIPQSDYRGNLYFDVRESGGKYYIYPDESVNDVNTYGQELNIFAVAHKETVTFENLASYATEGDKTFVPRTQGLRFNASTSPEDSDEFYYGALTKAALDADEMLNVSAAGTNNEDLDIVLLYYVFDENNEFVDNYYVDRAAGETFSYASETPCTVYILTIPYFSFDDGESITVTHSVSEITEDAYVSVSFEGVNVDLSEDITGEKLFLCGTQSISGTVSLKDGYTMYDIYAKTNDGATQYNAFLNYDYYTHEFYIDKDNIMGDVTIYAVAVNEATPLNDESATKITSKNYTDTFVPAKSSYLLCSEGNDPEDTYDDTCYFGKAYKYDITESSVYTLSVSDDFDGDYRFFLYAEDDAGNVIINDYYDSDSLKGLGEEINFEADYTCTLYVGAVISDSSSIFEEATFTLKETKYVTLDNVTYNVTDEYADIINCNSDNASGKIVIPATVEGVPVIKISNYAFSYCSEITEIVIPQNVETIGFCAFSNCEGLTKITLPASLTYISDYAFEVCTSLETVQFEGTEAQWNEIIVEEYGNGWLTDAEFIFNVIYGDLNGDTFVNKKDDLAMRKYLADPTYEIDLEAANVFYDNTVNKKDLLRLKQHLADPDVLLGPEEEIVPDNPFDLPEDNTEN